MTFEHIALLGISDAALVRRLSVKLQRPGCVCHLPVAENLTRLRERLAEATPAVVLVDEAILGEFPLETAVREIAKFAPAVVLTAPKRQTELASLVALGEVDFVPRVGDFAPLVASLIERRFRWAERADGAPGPFSQELPGDFPEILRHEINNPLTGILGNAELLLAHRERLSAWAAQRLETIVDLSVRLRETIRRLSHTWEVGQQSRSTSVVSDMPGPARATGEPSNLPR